MKALHPHATVLVKEASPGRWKITVAYSQTFSEDELADVESAMVRLRGMKP